MQIATLALLALATLAASLSAGLFFAFSVFVMAGLGAASPGAAIEAMRGINGAVRSAGFLFAFAGPLVLPFLAAILAWTGGARGAASLAAGAGAIYALLVFGVTVAINVPLNQSLDAARFAPGEAASVWAGYAVPWTRWNHVRSAGAIACCGLLVAALVELGRQ